LAFVTYDPSMGPAPRPQPNEIEHVQVLPIFSNQADIPDDASTNFDFDLEPGIFVSTCSNNQPAVNELCNALSKFDINFSTAYQSIPNFKNIQAATRSTTINVKWLEKIQTVEDSKETPHFAMTKRRLRSSDPCCLAVSLTSDYPGGFSLVANTVPHSEIYPISALKVKLLVSPRTLSKMFELLDAANSVANDEGNPAVFSHFTTGSTTMIVHTEMDEENMENALESNPDGSYLLIGLSNLLPMKSVRLVFDAYGIKLGPNSLCYWRVDPKTGVQALEFTLPGRRKLKPSTTSKSIKPPYRSAHYTFFDNHKGNNFTEILSSFYSSRLYKKASKQVNLPKNLFKIAIDTSNHKGSESLMSKLFLLSEKILSPPDDDNKNELHDGQVYDKDDQTLADSCHNADSFEAAATTTSPLRPPNFKELALNQSNKKRPLPSSEPAPKKKAVIAPSNETASSGTLGPNDEAPNPDRMNVEEDPAPYVKPDDEHLPEFSDRWAGSPSPNDENDSGGSSL
jgi:hypothetical protein